MKGTEQVCVAEDWQMGTHKEVKVKQVEDISLRVQPIVSQKTPEEMYRRKASLQPLWLAYEKHIFCCYARHCLKKNEVDAIHIICVSEVDVYNI